MNQIKITMIQHLSGAESYETGKTYSFSENEAYRLIKAGIATCSEKVKKNLFAKIEELKQIKEEEEKALAVILHKQELLAERTKLQLRVDEITDALGDASDYYKSYSDLGEEK